MRTEGAKRECYIIALCVLVRILQRKRTNRVWNRYVMEIGKLSPKICTVSGQVIDSEKLS